MSDAEMRERLSQRFLVAQTLHGRWRLSAYAAWKCHSWRLVVQSAFAIKRAFDVVMSVMALVMLSPVFAVIALLVKLDGGQIFFKQTRIGLHGKEFKMIKFRSMCVDAEAKLQGLLKHNEKSEGVTFKMKN